MTRLLSCLFAGFALTAATANAGLLASEDFSYADGALVPNGTWANHSGTLGTLAVAGGAAVVTQDSGSEDANMSFASQSSGILTASFDITVTAPGAMTGSGFEYFAHFYPTANNFSFHARTDIQAPNGTGDYTIGIATLSSTGEVALPTDFSFGAVVPVEVSFDLDGGTASLTAGGNTVNSSVISVGQVIDAFALRQSNSSSDETIVVDNLVISHTAAIPEPGTVVLTLLALSGVGVVSMRSRLG